MTTSNMPDFFLLSDTQRHSSKHPHPVAHRQVLQVVHQTFPLTHYNKHKRHHLYYIILMQYNLIRVNSAHHSSDSLHLLHL